METNDIDLIVEDVMSQLIEARKDNQLPAGSVDLLVQQAIDELKVDAQLKGRIYDAK